MLLPEQENKQIMHNIYITTGFNENSFKTYLAYFKLSKICLSSNNTAVCVCHF